MQEKLLITGRRLFAALLVCLAILAAGNFVVQRLTAHTVARRILADTRAASPSQIIALGNSLMRSGFIPDSFGPPASPQDSSPAFNLAMGASTPVEQLLLFRAGLRSFSKPRLLLYGFYDFQLTDPVAFANADLVGNHDILYYQEPQFARRYFSMTRYESAAFEATRRFPMLAERGAVWAKVELLRRYLSQQGMPAEVRNQFGRVGDFTLLEARNREEFEQHCAIASYEKLNAPVSEIIREAQQQGIRVVVIVMPLPPKHVQSFYDTPAWSAYQRHIQQLLAAQSVSYLDASAWIPDGSKFGDALHLTPEGADEFSRRLGALCSDLENLNACSTTEK
jgi:hypothetical protein